MFGKKPADPKAIAHLYFDTEVELRRLEEKIATLHSTLAGAESEEEREKIKDDLARSNEARFEAMGQLPAIKKRLESTILEDLKKQVNDLPAIEKEITAPINTFLATVGRQLAFLKQALPAIADIQPEGRDPVFRLQSEIGRFVAGRSVDHFGVQVVVPAFKMPGVMLDAYHQEMDAIDSGGVGVVSVEAAQDGYKKLARLKKLKADATAINTEAISLAARMLNKVGRERGVEGLSIIDKAKRGRR